MSQEKQNAITLENAGRRKAVKTLIGGATAIAAYNLLPTKWGTPIIEQIFLPAHAATSGCLITGLSASIKSGDSSSSTVVVNVTGQVTCPGATSVNLSLTSNT